MAAGPSSSPLHSPQQPIPIIETYSLVSDACTSHGSTGSSRYSSFIVRLTDASSKALNQALSEARQKRAKGTFNNGYIEFSNRGSSTDGTLCFGGASSVVHRFSLMDAQRDLGPKGQLDVIEQQQGCEPSELKSVGPVSHRVQISATTEDTFESTKQKAQQANQEMRKNAPKVVMKNPGPGGAAMKAWQKINKATSQRPLTPLSNQKMVNGKVATNSNVGGAPDVSKRPLRQRIMYKLLANPSTSSDLLNKLGIEGMTDYDRSIFNKTLNDVAQPTKSTDSASSPTNASVYELKRSCFTEIRVDDWPFYSNWERQVCRKKLLMYKTSSNEHSNSASSNAVDDGDCTQRVSAKVSYRPPPKKPKDTGGAASSSISPPMPASALSPGPSCGVDSPTSPTALLPPAPVPAPTRIAHGTGTNRAINHDQLDDTTVQRVSAKPMYRPPAPKKPAINSPPIGINGKSPPPALKSPPRSGNNGKVGAAPILGSPPQMVNGRSPGTAAPALCSPPTKRKAHVPCGGAGGEPSLPNGMHRRLESSMSNGDSKQAVPSAMTNGNGKRQMEHSGAHKRMDSGNGKRADPSKPYNNGTQKGMESSSLISHGAAQQKREDPSNAANGFHKRPAEPSSFTIDSQKRPDGSSTSNGFHNPKSRQKTVSTPNGALKRPEPTSIPNGAAKRAEPMSIPNGVPKYLEPTSIPNIAPKRPEPTTIPNGALKRPEPMTIPNGVPKHPEPTSIPNGVVKHAEPQSVPNGIHKRLEQSRSNEIHHDFPIATNIQPKRRKQKRPPSSASNEIAESISTVLDNELSSEPRLTSPPLKRRPISVNDTLDSPPAKRRQQTIDETISNVCEAGSSSPPSDPNTDDDWKSSQESLMDYQSEYPAIASANDRRRYKEEFDRDYPLYLKLYQHLRLTAAEFEELGEQLKRTLKDSMEYREVEREIFVKYFQFQQDSDMRKSRKEHERLRKKLGVIKERVKQYDDRKLFAPRMNEIIRRSS